MEGTPSSGFRITPQAVLGMLIIGVGVLLTLDNLTWVETDRILRYWPLGIVVAGIVKLAQCRELSGRLVGLVMIGIGAVWTADSVLELSVDIGDFWPIALIALGVVIISRARRGAEVVAGAPLTADSSVTEVAIWAGKQRRNASSAFRRADLTAVMGGIELDLRSAATATGEAVIDVFIMWGGVEIWVPPDWAVSNQVALLMGGAEDKSTGTRDARHRLIVRGFVVMGGLEIKT